MSAGNGSLMNGLASNLCQDRIAQETISPGTQGHCIWKSHFRIVLANLDNLDFNPDYPADPSGPN